MTRRWFFNIRLLAVSVLLAGLGLHAAQAQSTDTFDHSDFDAVLETYVDEQGMVDYAGLQENRAEHFDPYLDQLAEANPEALTSDEELAFWINAYNALALDLIIEHYPVESIWEPTPGETMETTEENPFEIPVGTVAGKSYTLDEVEHNEIDDTFDDPRFHFAIVCAAMSCPPLRMEAYTGQQIDDQLHDQAVQFIREHPDNRLEPTDGTVHVSTVFEWFKHDFGGDEAGIQRYIASYVDGDLQQRLEQAAFDVAFTEYDWTLNSQPLFDQTARR